MPLADEGIFHDGMVPDHLISDAMVKRYLEISPPLASVIPEFQLIINEIERSYVLGMLFSAVSASCVTIERLLNLARIHLHKHHPVIKALWNKGASNEWYENIDALHTWSYFDEDFAKELKWIYKNIRCKYLHSGSITDLEGDALKSIQAAYQLLKIFLGFPESLFRIASSIECLNENDPRFIEFYRPQLHSDEQE
jgi:hypothetical protein